MADTWDIQGVTSSQGTPVNVDNSSDWINYEIDPNKDSTVSALEAKAAAEGLESIIDSNQSEWDRQWALDKLLEIGANPLDYQGQTHLVGMDESRFPERSYLAGEGLLGQAGQFIEPFLQTISGNTLGRRMGESYEDFLERTEGEVRLAADYGLSRMPPNWIQRTNEDWFPGYFSKTDKKEIKKAEEKVEKIIKKYDLPALDELSVVSEASADTLPQTPAGTTDIYDINTGDWTQVKTEEEEIDELINQLSRPRVKENQLSRELAKRNLQADIRREAVEQPRPLVANIAPDVLNVDLNKAIEDLARQAELSAAIEEDVWPGFKDNYVEDLPEFDANYLELDPSQLPVRRVESPAVESAGTVAEEFFPGAGMTADESRARTRELNEAEYQRTLADIEARKQQDAYNSGESEGKKKGVASVTEQISEDIFQGLSAALIDVLNADSELMEQYLSSRASIKSMLDKVLSTENDATPGGFTTNTRYVSQPLTHEEWYPGSQAASTQAGFWGPMALPWNEKYRDYKDAQRGLMGLEEGEKFWSDDWIRTFGWMTPEQINRVSGY